MLILALLAAAAAALCWPEVHARDRLRPRPVRPALGPVRHLRLLVVLASAVVGFFVAGPAGLLSGAGLALLGAHHWRSLRGRRDRLARADELTAGLRLLVAQLRAGAHPASAAEGAAAEAGAVIAGVFRDMATTVRLGGDVATVLRNHELVELRAPLGRIARAWALAERHGVALADLLDAVRRDVERRTAFRRGVDAKLAGPRSTAAVLTGLPVCGLLFGEAIGSAPLAVLNGGLLGQLMLLVGTALLAAGASWTLRLTEAVAS